MGSPQRVDWLRTLHTSCVSLPRPCGRVLACRTRCVSTQSGPCEYSEWPHVSTQSGPCARILGPAGLLGASASGSPSWRGNVIESSWYQPAHPQPALSRALPASPVRRCRSTIRLHLTPCFISVRPGPSSAVAPFEPNGLADAGGRWPCAGGRHGRSPHRRDAARSHAACDLPRRSQRHHGVRRAYANTRTPVAYAALGMRRRFTTAIRTIVHSAMVTAPNATVATGCSRVPIHSAN